MSYCFCIFSADIDFRRFEEHLKDLKGTTNRKIFRPGQQMANNTYGGKTLHQIEKEVLKVDQKAHQSPGQQSCTNSQGSSPNHSHFPLPGMAAHSPKRGKKAIPLPQPKPKKISQPEMRVPPYMNITGHTGNVPPPPPDYPPPDHQDDEPEDDDDEQEDEYIAPSQLRNDAEEEEEEEEGCPIYQNYQSNGITEQPQYLNVGGFAENEAPAESPSLYQNVDFSAAGKAKPKVRPRVPKKPRGHH